MNKKGFEASIATIVWMILGLVLAVVLLFAIYQGVNKPAKGAIDKGKEFLASLNDLSLSEIRENIKKNPSGFLSGLFLGCEGGGLDACRQYIAICEKGENEASSINKLDSNEIQKLLEKDTYLPVEKSLIKNSPLIDWVILLIILVISLAAEWFIRKFNGLL